MKFLIPFLLLPTLAVGQPRYGHEPYGPPSPLDVCVSPITGQIAIAETEKNEVVLLDSNWKVERTLGADSKIERPVSIARTPSDELVALVAGDPMCCRLAVGDCRRMVRELLHANRQWIRNPRLLEA